MNDLIQQFLETDARISEQLAPRKDARWFHRLMLLISHSADSWYWLLGVAALWLRGGREIKQYAILWGIGLVILAAVVLAMKFLVRRPRPEGQLGQIYRVTDPHSFPSGHAARAMAIAIIALGSVPPDAFVVILIWAILVGYSRVALKLHYFSDVLAGWVIGIGAGAMAKILLPKLVEWFPRLFHLLTTPLF
jgi:undecaprenyl-diphosphatase